MTTRPTSTIDQIEGHARRIIARVLARHRRRRRGQQAEVAAVRLGQRGQLLGHQQLNLRLLRRDSVDRHLSIA